MTFLGLRSIDLIGIASAERARRAEAMRRIGGITVAQRRTDAAEWAAIVEWLQWAIPGKDRGRMPAGDAGFAEADHLYRVIADITAAAVRDWYANGRTPGEPEARAFLLVRLAQAFARLTGNAWPTVDGGGGRLIVPPIRSYAPDGARIVGDLSLLVQEQSP